MDSSRTKGKSRLDFDFDTNKNLEKMAYVNEAASIRSEHL